MLLQETDLLQRGGHFRVCRGHEVEVARMQMSCRVKLHNRPSHEDRR
jgi:hypothetical protein